MSNFSMDSFRLDGKIALVTGGIYGIGFGIAVSLAEAGATIVYNSNTKEAVERAAEDYKAKGIDAKGYVFDITNESEVQQAVKQIEQEVGTIDILVNNAGIIKRIPMLEMSSEDFRKVVDVDLTGQFIMSKAVLPGMIDKGHGKIINICSMMSELGRETVSAYAAAKVA